MRSVFFLAVIAAPLIALADPEGSPFADLVRRLPDPNLHARSSIDPSSVSKECQSTCTPIIKTLDACDSVASCECTQGNYDALGTCLNCLQALGPPYFLSGLYSTAQDYGDSEVRSPSRHVGPTDVAADVAFYDACGISGFELNDISITATPTGIVSTGNPLSIFDAPTPTPGATQAVSVQENPLIPTRAVDSTAKTGTGGAVGLSALRSLKAGAVVAVATIAIFMGGLPL
ncbi:hypothetical protein EDB83DRAFT_2452984 [Lactarius deliciosus]|nr:hypothetical protein EDB83DRAFT_2452984 [Lactarius deliciosus]